MMTLVDMLSELGISIINSSAGTSGSIWFQCPECNNPKAYMFQDRWPYNIRCFAKGGHLSTTLPGLMAKIKNIPYRDAARDLAARLHLKIIKKIKQTSSLTVEIKTQKIPKGWVPIDFEQDKKQLAWLKGRGFAEDWIIRANIQVDPMRSEWLLFPTTEQGEVVTFECRCIVKKEDWKSRLPWVKTKSPAGIKNNQFLYGHDMVIPETPLIICEGIPNWFTLVQAGFNAVSIFGSSPSQRQVELMAQFSPTSIILAFDGDEAGFGAIEKIQQFLSSLVPGKNIGLWFIPGGEDINDIQDPDLLWKSYENRKTETLLALAAARLGEKKRDIKRSSQFDDLYGYRKQGRISSDKKI